MHARSQMLISQASRMLYISTQEALLFSGPKEKKKKRGHRSDLNQTAFK